MSIIYATKSINERWSWPGYVTDEYGLRDIGRVSQFKSAAAGKQTFKPLILVKSVDIYHTIDIVSEL